MRCPYAAKKKRADTSIDSVIYFKPDGKTTEKAIVSRKGGANVNIAIIRELGTVTDRENADPSRETCERAELPSRKSPWRR